MAVHSPYRIVSGVDIKFSERNVHLACIGVVVLDIHKKPQLAGTIMFDVFDANVTVERSARGAWDDSTMLGAGYTLRRKEYAALAMSIMM